MTLSLGSDLAPYEILGPLGASGMGEVGALAHRNDGYNEGICGSRFEMTVTSGSRLEPYEMISPLGAGGMGRTVEVKLLPQHLSFSPNIRPALRAGGEDNLAVFASPHLHADGAGEKENGADPLFVELLDPRT